MKKIHTSMKYYIIYCIRIGLTKWFHFKIKVFYKINITYFSVIFSHFYLLCNDSIGLIDTRPIFISLSCDFL